MIAPKCIVHRHPYASLNHPAKSGAVKFDPNKMKTYSPMYVPRLCAKKRSNTVTSHKDSIGETMMPINALCAIHSPADVENAVHTIIGTVRSMLVRYTPR